MTEKFVQPQHGRLFMIDVLRGLAVFMVMIRHLAFNVTGINSTNTGAVEQYPGDWFNGFAEFGEYGVHLFLTLSGFCIHYRWAKTGQGTVPFLPFWKRRLIRLYPPFILALSVAVAALFVLHGVIHKAFPDGPAASWFGYASTKQFVIDLMVLLTLTQNLNGASQRIGNGPFWSLALEEQLYLLYFPFLRIRRHLGWRAALAVPLILTLVWRSVGVIFFESPPQFWFVTAPAFWISWCLGALAAENATGLATVSKTWSSPAVLTMALTLAVSWHVCTDLIEGELFRGISHVGLELFIGVAWFQLVLFAVRIEPIVQLSLVRRSWISPLWRTLSWLGVCSYSIYLLHDMAFTAVKQICVSLEFPLFVVLCVRFASGVLVGLIFYKTVEKYFHVKSQQVGTTKSSKPV